MPSSFLLPFLAALLLIIPPASRAADSPGRVKAEDEKAVRALAANFAAAFARHDASVIARLFQEEGDFTRAGAMLAHGQAAIEEYHHLLFENEGDGAISSFKQAELEILDTRVRFLRPDVAAVDMTARVSGGVQDGRTQGPRKSLNAFVLTKEGDGWRIATLHVMDWPERR